MGVPEGDSFEEMKKLEIGKKEEVIIEEETSMKKANMKNSYEEVVVVEEMKKSDSSSAPPLSRNYNNISSGSARKPLVICKPDRRGRCVQHNCEMKKYMVTSKKWVDRGGGKGYGSRLQNIDV